MKQKSCQKDDDVIEIYKKKNKLEIAMLLYGAVDGIKYPTQL